MGREFVQNLPPIAGGASLPSYEVTLGSGAVVEMSAWPLGHSLKEVQSGGTRVSRIKRLLKRCLVRVIDPGPYQFDSQSWDWNQVLFSDWDAAIMAARIATFGPLLEVSQPCPNNNPSLRDQRCSGHLNMAGDDSGADGFAIDLDRILKNDVFEIPDETAEALRRGENRFEINWNGINVKFLVPTGQTWKQIEAGLKDPRRKKDAASWVLACRIIELEGRTAKNDIMKALKDPALPAGFAEVLRKMDKCDSAESILEYWIRVFDCTCQI